jgi:hypothetical protein
MNADLPQSGRIGRKRTSPPEALARAALEERFGRPLSEEEWRVYRSRLVAFATLLGAWNAPEKDHDCSLGSSENLG